MGISFIGSSKSASAPDIEEGEYLGRFDGVTAKTLEKSQFDPNVFIWAFTLLTDEQEVIYDEGEPVVVEKLTSQSVNVKSKTTPGAVKVLKVLMKPEEFTAFESGDEENAVSADELVGRIVKLEVVNNDNGWPTIESISKYRKVTKTKAANAAEEE